MHQLLLPPLLASLLAAPGAAAQSPALSVQLAVAGEYARDTGQAAVTLTVEAKDKAELSVGLLSGAGIEVSVAGGNKVPLAMGEASGTMQLGKGAKLTLELPFDVAEVLGRLSQKPGVNDVVELELSAPGAGAPAKLKVVKDLKDVDVKTLDLTKTKVVLVTNFGSLTVGLRPDKAPKTVENFVKLAKDHFYDGTRFHRVIRGFMIQGGDPNSKDADPSNDGQGGPGYTVNAEFNDIKHERGVLSMARSTDPNSAGSQFFVVHGVASHLDGQYTAFGSLVDGLEALDRIAEVPVSPNAQGEPSVPSREIVVHRAVVLAGK